MSPRDTGHRYPDSEGMAGLSRQHRMVSIANLPDDKKAWEDADKKRLFKIDVFRSERGLFEPGDLVWQLRARHIKG